MPAIRSSRNAEKPEKALRTRSHCARARSRMACRVNPATSATTTSTPPIIRFWVSMIARMPASSSAPPRICSTNWEKKLARAATSPSTRSMMSPGEVDVWKCMSR